MSEDVVSSVALPEHPMRNKWWFQFLDRVWRLTIYWASAVGTAYIMFLGHWINRPMPVEYATICLIFIGGLIGNKTFEKLKGTA